jgi:hypothetical protein
VNAWDTVFLSNPGRVGQFRNFPEPSSSANICGPATSRADRVSGRGLVSSIVYSRPDCVPGAFRPPGAGLPTPMRDLPFGAPGDDLLRLVAFYRHCGPPFHVQGHTSGWTSSMGADQSGDGPNPVNHVASMTRLPIFAARYVIRSIMYLHNLSLSENSRVTTAMSLQSEMSLPSASLRFLSDCTHQSSCGGSIDPIFFAIRCLLSCPINLFCSPYSRTFRLCSLFHLSCVGP